MAEYSIEDVERVARAIVTANEVGPDSFDVCRGKASERNAMGMARAAIEALKE